jgi:hypothetical protein
MATRDEYLQAISRIIARCWADPAEQQRFITDPNTVLAAEGLVVPPGVTITVHSDTETSRHLVIPLPSTQTVQNVEDDLREFGYAAFCSTFCT